MRLKDINCGSGKRVLDKAAKLMAAIIWIGEQVLSHYYRLSWRNNASFSRSIC